MMGYAPRSSANPQVSFRARFWPVRRPRDEGDNVEATVLEGRGRVRTHHPSPPFLLADHDPVPPIKHRLMPLFPPPPRQAVAMDHRGRGDLMEPSSPTGREA